MIQKTTAFNPKEYDEKITRTIPCYDQIQDQILELIRLHTGGQPFSWLDTGCGTGLLGEKGLKCLSIERLVLSDPSPSMLDQARTRLADCIPSPFLLEKTSQALNFHREFDVVTSVFSHHYLNHETRRTAIRACWEALKPGGLYITFENCAPRSKEGKALQLKRWKAFQIQNGKTPEEAQAHLDRYGKEYFPISPEEQLCVLEQTGFSCCELFWCSYMQAGFFGIKE